MVVETLEFRYIVLFFIVLISSCSRQIINPATIDNNASTQISAHPCADISATSDNVHVLNIALALANYDRYQREVKVTQEHLAFHEVIYAQIQKRLESGVGMRGDSDLIQVYLDRARISQIKALGDLKSARLAYLLNSGENASDTMPLPVLSIEEMKKIIDIKLDDKQNLNLPKIKQLSCWNAFQQSADSNKVWARVVKYTKRLKKGYQKQFNIGRRSLVNILDVGADLLEAQIQYENSRFLNIQSAYHLLAQNGSLKQALKEARQNASLTH